MSVKIQVKRTTKQAWITANPTLDAGELGYETDTGNFKIGNGTSAWNSLSYAAYDSALLETRLAQEAWHKTVRLATAAVLPNTPTYTAGSTDLDGGTGIGAYFQSASNVRLTVDSVNTVTGDRILVKNQVDSRHNGVYDVTNQGSASAPWVLTRSSDMNGSVAGQISVGENVGVREGTNNYYQQFAISTVGAGTNGAHIIGTDGVTFVQWSGVASFNIGNGLTATGNTLNVVTASSDRIIVNADSIDLPTITQDNSTSVATGTFVSNVTRDGYGRVTGVEKSDVALTLGTHTSGDYVASLVAGTGVTLTNNSGETATPTVAIGQSVATSASVTFASVTAPLTGNASTATALETSRTIELTGDVTGSASFNGTATASISTTIAANSVALGTDTTGDFVQNLVAGTGITLTNNTGEGATPTVAVTTNTYDAYGAASTAQTNAYAYADALTTSDVAEGTPLYFTDERAQDAVGNAVGTGLTYTDSTGAIAVDTTTIQARVANVTDTEIGYLDGVTSAIQTQLNAKAPIASPTFTGTVTLAADPESALQAATKQYVDNVVSGVNFHQSVVAATTGNLAGTYNNGTSGIGATITKATNGSIGTIDGATVVVGSRILLKSQTDHKENGIYTVTAVGSAGAPWVVTRATDADNNPLGEMANGDFCFVTGGSTNAGYGYINNSTASPIIIGTDNITYSIFNAAQVVTGGDGLTFDGNTFNVGTASEDRIVVNADEIDLAIVPFSSSSNNSNSASSVVTSITVDSYGRVTARSSDSYQYASASNAGVVRINENNMYMDAGALGIKALSILNGDISTSAGIALSKLATSTAGNILVYNSSGVLTSVAETGDISISDTGVTAIASGVIVNADVSATAAIDLGKLADVSTNAQTASYTLVLADKNKVVEMSVATANNLTVPLNSSVAYPVGSQINILQTGAGQTTIVATGGVTINATPGLKMRAQWSYATLIKRATDTWVLVGDISA